MQESIGDSIFLGFMTPQNLNRLGLLPDQYLFTPSVAQSQQTSNRARACNPNDNRHQNVTSLGKSFTKMPCKYQKLHSEPSTLDAHYNQFDLSLLLKMALNKIPQIPFEYILDVFRWNLFSGNVSMANANVHFWHLALNEQGIHPPDWENRKNFFDAGAKYHVADNTPFVR